MSPFNRLHPSVRHHIVNSLGWTSLRPHQEQAIEPILDGQHVLVQAPTAGGKTEAAMIPLLSRMLAEGWDGTSVLYLCPLKALLNDLEVRLRGLGTLIGRRVALWHGDVGTAARRRITSERPDILLATPESVEVMLVSRLVDHHAFFRPLRAIVVDEIHAFAGDDRGWHLLALLERVRALAATPPQRIGLSATLGNAGEMLDWLIAGRDERRLVVEGSPSAGSAADVQVDYVGSIANAATVISRLHRGEKRLVFCDSRSQVESLATELRVRDVQTYVSHSSLSRDERSMAETAFAQGSDCVIATTSTLELGIDVGDLDRVIQIDAPYTVASFLQRLGRSGRRTGSVRNCLFLTTTDDAFLRALGLLRLREDGFVEPVRTPAHPYHVLAQQILALALQEKGVARVALSTWLGQFPATASVHPSDLQELLDFLLEEGILFEDGGLLALGAEGERRYGRKNFLEIFSVFLSPPLFLVYHGRTEIGQVHEDTFRVRGKSHERMILSLGGRGWWVTHVDWSAKKAYVEPADESGRSRWFGTGQPMRFELCQAIKRVLSGSEGDIALSKRAIDRLAALREQFSWVRFEGTELIVEPTTGRTAWWTFAGSRFNAAIAGVLNHNGSSCASDAFKVDMQSERSSRVENRIDEAILYVQREGYETNVDPSLIKFADLVPPRLVEEMVEARSAPNVEEQSVATQKRRRRHF